MHFHVGNVGLWYQIITYLERNYCTASQRVGAAIHFGLHKLWMEWCHPLLKGIVGFVGCGRSDASVKSWEFVWHTDECVAARQLEPSHRNHTREWVCSSSYLSLIAPRITGIWRKRSVLVVFGSPIFCHQSLRSQRHKSQKELKKEAI